MNRSNSMTLTQRAVVNQLLADGFRVDEEENKVVRMKRGNDYRIVLLNGTQKRAVGGKR